MWAAGRVGEISRRVGVQGSRGGGRVHVGRVGSDWWGGSYWSGKRVIRCVAKHGVQVGPAGLGDKTVGRSQRGVSRRTNGR